MSQESTAAAPALYRHAGPWLALIMVVFILFNAARAWLDPVAFATYYGTPLAAESEVSFVLVYAIRALFLGVLAGWLLMTRRLDALSVMAFASVVMAAGDAFLTYSQGAALGTVVRHVGIGVFLLVTGLLLRGAARALGLPVSAA